MRTVRLRHEHGAGVGAAVDGEVQSQSVNCHHLASDKVTALQQHEPGGNYKWIKCDWTHIPWILLTIHLEMVAESSPSVWVSWLCWRLQPSASQFLLRDDSPHLESEIMKVYNFTNHISFFVLTFLILFIGHIQIQKLTTLKMMTMGVITMFLTVMKLCPTSRAL